MKSTKIFVIGDPHFKINNVEETNEMSQKILQKLEEIKPDAVVCLGDVLDRHETIHVGPLQRSIDLFQKIAIQFPLYILIGNHDRPSNQVFLTDEHPFTALKMWKNTWIIDNVVESIIDNKKFLFVPYVPVGRFMEAINKEVVKEVGKEGVKEQGVKEEGVKEQVVKEQGVQGQRDLSEITCIFAHQEFYGAKMGMTISEIGDVWPSEYPLVVSGHIHDFDQLAPNLIYTGTPIQHAFGDREDKFVFLFEFNCQNDFTFQKIDLGLAKKKIVKLGFSEISALKKLDINTYYKIIISGTPEELKTLKIGNLIQTHPRCKIVYKTISTSLDKMNQDVGVDSKGFLEMLYDEIDVLQDFEERQDLREMAQKLFGVLESNFVIV
jgi:DNA repair exonuclease SbcCD nuclease subunit